MALILEKKVTKGPNALIVLDLIKSKTVCLSVCLSVCTGLKFLLNKNNSNNNHLMKTLKQNLTFTEYY